MSLRTWLSVCLSAFFFGQSSCGCAERNLAAGRTEDRSLCWRAGRHSGPGAHRGHPLARGASHPGQLCSGHEHGRPGGGLYATGNSPDEIRELVNGIQLGRRPERRGSVRRHGVPAQRGRGRIPNGLEFGIKKGIQFPSGFNSGHQVGLILDRIALPYSGIKSFDDLPIPFACVATDLVNNKQHVFRDGPLATALRSTMSLPGVFIPVRANRTVFVDGGLLDNIPVDVAKEMGAELTIGVHLATKPLAATEPIFILLVFWGNRFLQSIASTSCAACSWPTF